MTADELEEFTIRMMREVELVEIMDLRRGNPTLQLQAEVLIFCFIREQPEYQRLLREPADF